MARPNISQTEVLNWLTKYGQATVEHLVNELNYSEPTIRKALARLVKDGNVKVASESRPYYYGAIV